MALTRAQRELIRAARDKEARERVDRERGFYRSFHQQYTSKPKEAEKVAQELTSEK